MLAMWVLLRNPIVLRWTQVVVLKDTNEVRYDDY